MKMKHRYFLFAINTDLHYVWMLTSSRLHQRQQSTVQFTGAKTQQRRQGRVRWHVTWVGGPVSMMMTTNSTLVQSRHQQFKFYKTFPLKQHLGWSKMVILDPCWQSVLAAGAHWAARVSCVAAPVTWTRDINKHGATHPLILTLHVTTHVSNCFNWPSYWMA